jgi:putative flippase GtrA
MFTPGKIAFAIAFLVIFVLGMIWSYKKDSFSNKIHFKGAFKIIIFVGILILALFLFVKLRHRL